MREIRQSGCVGGVGSNPYPYRNPHILPTPKAALALRGFIARALKIQSKIRGTNQTGNEATTNQVNINATDR